MGTPASSAEFLDPITENPAPGTTEVWRIYNNTADTHPIHLHQVAYQVLARQAFSTKLVNLGPSPSGHTTMWGMSNTRLLGAPALAVGNEVAWKDTIQINPGEVITVRATFDLPGKYVTHCHILSHEEHDMMRFMQVGDVAYPPPNFVVDSSGARVPPVIAAVAGPIAHSGTTFSTVAVTPLPKDEEILTIGDQVLA